MSVGRIITLIQCRIQEPRSPRSVTLAYVEELWQYDRATQHPDPLTSEFQCRRVYRTAPRPTYYVIDLWRIVCPAPVVPDPRTPTIPHGSIPRVVEGLKQYPCAKADTAPGKHDGSELFVLNKWCLKKGKLTTGNRDKLGACFACDVRLMSQY